MRLLVINPNISESVSALILVEAERCASPGTRVTMLTAPFGVAYIETRFEALIGAYACAQLAAEHQAGHDAVIIAAFGDPGLGGLREALPVPVLGRWSRPMASSAGWRASERSIDRSRASATCRASTLTRCANFVSARLPRMAQK